MVSVIQARDLESNEATNSQDSYVKVWLSPSREAKAQTKVNLLSSLAFSEFFLSELLTVHGSFTVCVLSSSNLQKTKIKYPYTFCCPMHASRKADTKISPPMTIVIITIIFIPNDHHNNNNHTYIRNHGLFLHMILCMWPNG